MTPVQWSKLAAVQESRCTCFFVSPPSSQASRWIRYLWSMGASLILEYLQTFLSFCVLDDFFRFSKKIGFLGILGPPGNHASRWIRDLWSKGILLILAYLQTFLSFCVLEDFFRFSKIWVFGYYWSTLHMVETTLPDGLETSGQRVYLYVGISLDVFEFQHLRGLFAFFKKRGFWVFLVHPTVVSVLLSASVERCFVSRMRDFF